VEWNTSWIDVGHVDPPIKSQRHILGDPGTVLDCRVDGAGMTNEMASRD
jgi:hypothetical protein